MAYFFIFGRKKITTFIILRKNLREKKREKLSNKKK